MSKLITVNIPDLGEVDEVEVIEICVKAGDKVQSEDSIIILETDKAAMEIPSTEDGVVKKILLSEGDIAKQGIPFLEIEVDNKIKNEKNIPKAEPAKEENVVKKNTTTEVNYKNIDSSKKKKLDNIPNNSHSGPAVRKLAREFGIDLNLVIGSGPHNRILKEDLHAFVSNKLNNDRRNDFIFSQPEEDYSKWGVTKEEKFTKFQKTALKNLHTSWINIPHVTQHDDADISDLLDLRNGFNKKHKLKISPLAFIVKGVVNCLKEYPIINTSISSGIDNIIYKDYFNIGIAIDTPNGLIVPNIKNADKKSICQIADAIKEFSEKAKNRQLKVDDLKGATFTISSLSGIGGKYFTPIINPPEVAILGLSKPFDSLKLKDKKVVSQKLLPLSLSYDHRVVNGAYAAQFITSISKQLIDMNYFKKNFNAN
ncbi:MAG: dihydrolipoyllysine acetyltransferase [Gammaproteobacteria bacterium]|nr:dihydrolipoyllysine acetyltransferase [Gammaproteobacteria bacterium]|tara:strand:- start:1562 stop:2836 length:1275 start_codon:yes stop_codon:yes gene_type:complete